MNSIPTQEEISEAQTLVAKINGSKGGRKKWDNADEITKKQFIRTMVEARLKKQREKSLDTAAK